MNTIIKALVAAAAALAGATPALAAGHVTKRPQVIHVNIARPCVIFRLEGVGQADPALPNVEYFALLRSHPNFQEALAMLLTSKAANLPISVHTSGALAPECSGFAVVDIMVLD